MRAVPSIVPRLTRQSPPSLIVMDFQYLKKGVQELNTCEHMYSVHCTLMQSLWKGYYLQKWQPCWSVEENRSDCQEVSFLNVASPLNSISKAPPPLLPSNIAWLHLAIAFTIVLPFITKHALRWTKGIGDPSIFFFFMKLTPVSQDVCEKADQVRTARGLPGGRGNSNWYKIVSI